MADEELGQSGGPLAALKAAHAGEELPPDEILLAKMEELRDMAEQQGTPYSPGDNVAEDALLAIRFDEAVEQGEIPPIPRPPA